MIVSLAAALLLAAPTTPPETPPVTGQPLPHVAAALGGASLDELAKQLQNPLVDLVSLSCYANVVHPDGGSPWLTRMVVTFMFPK